MDESFIYGLALTMIPSIGSVRAKRLVDQAGSIPEVFTKGREELDVSPALFSSLQGISSYLAEAGKAYDSACEKGIQCISIDSPLYPRRLLECPDAPIVLFYCGNADLNSAHIPNLVGTREATGYGKECCSRILEELASYCSDILVVSGLAYGIDIVAHREALRLGLNTVGVLAHGLDRIYPHLHRSTASQMVKQGGLLTEYPFGTKPDRFNFVARNRIIAGLSDVTVVIESAEKGGSLITAELADSYHRECFALPGRLSDPFSRGCNKLIGEQRARCFQSVNDLLSVMGWEQNKKQKKSTQLTLFEALEDQEKEIVAQLQAVERMDFNQLSIRTGFSSSCLDELLFGLEMNGVVISRPGGYYRLK